MFSFDDGLDRREVVSVEGRKERSAEYLDERNLWVRPVSSFPCVRSRCPCCHGSVCSLFRFRISDRCCPCSAGFSREPTWPVIWQKPQGLWHEWRKLWSSPHQEEWPWRCREVQCSPNGPMRTLGCFHGFGSQVWGVWPLVEANPPSGRGRLETMCVLWCGKGRVAGRRDRCRAWCCKATPLEGSGAVQLECGSWSCPKDARRSRRPQQKLHWRQLPTRIWYWRQSRPKRRQQGLERLRQRHRQRWRLRPQPREKQQRSRWSSQPQRRQRKDRPNKVKPGSPVPTKELPASGKFRPSRKKEERRCSQPRHHRRRVATGRLRKLRWSPPLTQAVVAMSMSTRRRSPLRKRLQGQAKREEPRKRPPQPSRFVEQMPEKQLWTKSVTNPSLREGSGTESPSQTPLTLCGKGIEGCPKARLERSANGMISGPRRMCSGDYKWKHESKDNGTKSCSTTGQQRGTWRPGVWRGEAGACEPLRRGNGNGQPRALEDEIDVVEEVLRGVGAQGDLGLADGRRWPSGDGAAPAVIGGLSNRARRRALGLLRRDRASGHNRVDGSGRRVGRAPGGVGSGSSLGPQPQELTWWRKAKGFRPRGAVSSPKPPARTSRASRRREPRHRRVDISQGSAKTRRGKRGEQRCGPVKAEARSATPSQNQALELATMDELVKAGQAGVALNQRAASAGRPVTGGLAGEGLRGLRCVKGHSPLFFPVGRQSFCAAKVGDVWSFCLSAPKSVCGYGPSFGGVVGPCPGSLQQVRTPLGPFIRTRNEVILSLVGGVAPGRHDGTGVGVFLCLCLKGNRHVRGFAERVSFRLGPALRSEVICVVDSVRVSAC